MASTISWVFLRMLGCSPAAVARHSATASALLREVVGPEAADGDLAFALAVSLVQRGRLDTAISVLSDALLRHPGQPRLRALMDRALRIRYPNGLP